MSTPTPTDGIGDERSALARDPREVVRRTRLRTESVHRCPQHRRRASRQRVGKRQDRSRSTVLTRWRAPRHDPSEHHEQARRPTERGHREGARRRRRCFRSRLCGDRLRHRSLFAERSPKTDGNVPRAAAPTCYRDVSFDQAGSLYARSACTDKDVYALIKLNANGGVLARIDEGSVWRKNSTGRVAVDGTGQLWVPHLYEANIHVLDAKGKVVTRFGVEGDRPGEIPRSALREMRARREADAFSSRPATRSTPSRSPAATSVASRSTTRRSAPRATSRSLPTARCGSLAATTLC